MVKRSTHLWAKLKRGLPASFADAMLGTRSVTCWQPNPVTGIAGDFAAVQLNIKYFKAKIKIAPFAANNG
ncbi:MAG TPA: hypothetical protein DCY88_09955 [Cyanobacteria bacterium UBA11372]|nr:hypothetical protein [Cyanobacteria bacterium UBA11372]